MAMMEVIENPRRRRYTAKQRAAGFGGKRRKRVRRPTRRRRNPVMASYANPTRRRTYRRSRDGRQWRRLPLRSYRRRRNPSLGGLGIDLGAAAWVASGMIGSEVVPTLVKKVWPGLPTVGPLGYGVRVGAAVATGMMIGKITKSRQSRNLAIAGGLSLVLVDLARQYVFPLIPGLAGLASDESIVRAEELEEVYGIGEYVQRENGGVGAYVQQDLPVGAVA